MGARFALLCLLLCRPGLAHTPTTMPFYSSCQFPSPHSTNPAEVKEYYRVCRVRQNLDFICDLHSQLTHLNVFPMVKMFDKHRPVFQDKYGVNIGILLVRQLTQPLSSEFVTEKSDEFGCLFRSPCQSMTPELAEKYVHSSRTFTRLYVSSLFHRWFRSTQQCALNKVLVLVVVDGIVGDARKLTSVNVHTDDHRLSYYINNIQLESTNSLLQGIPLVDVLADLLDQLGLAFREFHSRNGEPRRHVIPMWAWELATISVLLVVIALCIEWYIVRRKIASKRFIPSVQVDGARSKTHLIF